MKKLKILLFVLLVLFGSYIGVYDYHTNIRLDEVQNENTDLKAKLVKANMESSWFEELNHVIKSCQNNYALTLHQFR